MQQQTKIKKRAEAALKLQVQDLEHEKEKLEYLRDCRHFHTALEVYLQLSSHLTSVDQEDIRLGMRYLSRG